MDKVDILPTAKAGGFTARFGKTSSIILFEKPSVCLDGFFLPFNAKDFDSTIAAGGGKHKHIKKKTDRKTEKFSEKLDSDLEVRAGLGYHRAPVAQLAEASDVNFSRLAADAA